MENTRRARLESLILQELTMIIRQELKDPRVPSLTITSVKVTEDARQATIFVTPFGVIGDTEKEDQVYADCVKGLTAASGFLRRKLAPALQIRHIPSLLFKPDRGTSNSIRVHELLKEIAETSKEGGEKADD